MSRNKDFKEIAHSGGKLTITIRSDANGKRGYQLKWENSRPNASGILAVWALPQGAIVDSCPLGGIGQAFGPPPIAGCYQVFIGSDSEGMYGHECPNCEQYWRSEAFSNFCPYCGQQRSATDFISTAQRKYVALYCAEMCKVLSSSSDGDYHIDWDQIADAVGSECERPHFFYSEFSQQNNFTCNACGARTDVLGKFGYCSVCGTRNDLQEIKMTSLAQIRERVSSGGPYDNCVRDVVAVFDALVRRYIEQLVIYVPLTSSRKNRLTNMSYHNLEQVSTEMKTIFDIDIVAGLNAESFDFAKLMFFRRHIYEHNGGEADEKYIQESGDRSVKPKQLLRETSENAYRIIALVQKMSQNLTSAFEDILPPLEGPIKRKQKYAPIQP
jgi:hypothetical protein